MIAELIPRIAAEEAAETRYDGPWRPRCSGAGVERCVRADVYQGVGMKKAPLPGRSVMIFDDGDWHEELLLNWIRKSAFRVHSEQMGLNPLIVTGSHRGYTCAVCNAKVEPDVVHGHIDAIVTDPIGKDFLLECKSANHFSYQRWAAGTDLPWDYITQASLYVRGARMEGSNVEEALLLVKNKNTSQLLEFRIKPWLGNLSDEQPTVVVEGVYLEGERGIPVDFSCETECPNLLGRAVERFQQVVRYRDAAMVPSRPFEYGHWRCDWCPFAGTCWDGYEDETKELGEAGEVLLAGENADLAKLARQIYERNEVRKQAEKDVEEMKATMKIALMERELAAGLVNYSETHELTVKRRMQSRDGIDKEKIPEHLLPAVRKVTTFEVCDIRARKKKIPKTAKKSAKKKAKKKAAKKSAKKKAAKKAKPKE